MSPILLLASLLATDARSISLQASPVSWGSDCFSVRTSPASLTRMEGVCTGFSLRSRDSGDGFEGSCASLLGKIYAGAAAGTGTWGGDTTFVCAAAAYVLTGTPQGFLEGFFGPSICAGASLEGSWIGGDSASLAATGSLQFSVFPTFAIGASIREIPLVLAEGREMSSFVDYGATYIFNRDFRAMFSYSRDRARFGGQLAVSRALSLRAGTDGRSWSAGAGISLGRLTLDIAADFDDSTVSPCASVLFDIGGAEPWN
jgi:hypothetical protein